MEAILLRHCRGLCCVFVHGKCDVEKHPQSVLICCGFELMTEGWKALWHHELYSPAVLASCLLLKKDPKQIWSDAFGHQARKHGGCLGGELEASQRQDYQAIWKPSLHKIADGFNWKIFSSPADRGGIWNWWRQRTGIGSMTEEECKPGVSSFPNYSSSLAKFCHQYLPPNYLMLSEMEGSLHTLFIASQTDV